IVGTGQLTFTAEASEGTAVVEIAVTSDVPVASAVAFETLTSAQVNKDGSANETGENTVIAEHKDINDKAQTVTGETPQTPTTTPGKPGESTEPSTQPSESTTEETTSEETTEKTTQPSESTTEETTSEETTETTTERTSEPSEEPTPLNPSIKTVAELEGNEIVAGAEVTDTVTYEDLVPGAEYTLDASLINKETGDVIGRGAVSFTPTTSSGKVDVVITVNKNVDKPVAEAVAFEKLTSTQVNKDGSVNEEGTSKEIANHEDINDANQTVTGDVPETPETPETTEPEQPTDETSTTTETTEPTTSTTEPTPNPGGEKEPSETPSTEQTTEKTTEPTDSTDTTEPSDQPSETPSTEPTEPTDKPSETPTTEPGQPGKPGKPGQPSEKPSIETSAGIAGKAMVEKGAVVIDTVHFTGLKPGTKYELTGELMCKDTGKSTGAVGTMQFVPTTSAGSIDVPIVITDDQCATQVVFETLTDVDGKTVAVHHDINDEAQTVTDGKTPEQPSDNGQPNDNGSDNGQPNDNGTDNGADNGQPNKPGKSGNTTNNNLDKTIGQNNQNVTIIGGTGQNDVEDHGKALAPNAGRQTIKSVPSGSTGGDAHAMPRVA
ncbi:MAG: VaFE repeat-containing surface-anchored protein, partial [Corynebacterium sp.]|uniref:VaFE repeat-containing surface-anchored protein n=1 Tax=Corynebacterium sp. TaxID=1720 RepID=UPI0026DBD63C